MSWKKRFCIGMKDDTTPLDLCLAEVVLWIMLMLVAFSCGDGNKPPLPSIEGEWRSLIPKQPDWRYQFRRGLLTQYTTVGNTTISSKTYPYAERGDTLYIGGDQFDPPRRWLLKWECHTVVEVKQLDVQFPQLWWLRRE